MKKLSKVEEVILAISDHDKYNSYRCPEHGIYQIRKDKPEKEQVCLYCKKAYPALSNEEIKQLMQCKVQTIGSHSGAAL